MASSDHFRDKTAEDRPQASPRPTLSFGLAKRWVAKNGMDSPALILLPMIHPLRSATPLNSKAGHGARTPSSASLSMTNSAETPGKKMDGKKWIILLPMILSSIPPPT
jgi:hypothetical protein